jgi:hypothetical protein
VSRKRSIVSQILEPNPAVAPMPDRWWDKKAPKEDKLCYRTKTDCLNVFLDYNWRIVENVFRGANFNHGYEGFDNINHRFGLKGRQRVDTLAKAAWYALPGPAPWCLDNIDLNLLNDGDIANRAEVSFALPSHAQEQLMAYDRQEWWKDQECDPEQWRCCREEGYDFPEDDEVPF